MRRREIEHRLRQIGAPEPPPALRDRVMREAAAVVPSSAVGSGPADRVWYSAAWRAAWVAGIAALLLTEVVVVRSVERRFRSPGRASENPIQDVVRELGLAPDWRLRVAPSPSRSSMAETWLDLR